MSVSVSISIHIYEICNIHTYMHVCKCLYANRCMYTYVDIDIHVCIYLHTCICRKRESYFKELTYVIVEAGKSKICMAGWKFSGRS